MNPRYVQVVETASQQFGAMSIQQMDTMNVDRRVRHDWVTRGLITRAGTRSYIVAGSTPSWQQSLWCAAADVDGAGYPAGRSAARLQKLDDFTNDDIEVLVTRKHRNLNAAFRVASTSMPLDIGDTVTIDGIRCLSAERLILDGPLFEFTKRETENAIDSAIRRRLVSEQRLRTKIIDRHRSSINGGRILLDALVDTGGESRLERWFLALVRSGGLPRPTLQKVWRHSTRTVARVDAYFDGGLVVEVAGHGTHSSRTQIQNDEQRRTELVLRGLRVITFTYDDIKHRPDWVLARLREALQLAA